VCHVRATLENNISNGNIGIAAGINSELCTCFFHPTSSLSYWPIFGIEPANEMRISLSKAMWQGRCPRCREGYIFKYPLSQFTRFSDMNQSCDKCEASFEPNPDFILVTVRELWIHDCHFCGRICHPLLYCQSTRVGLYYCGYCISCFVHSS